MSFEKKELFNLKIFTKSLGAVLSGVYVGCQEVAGTGTEIYILKATCTASCRVGHHGREATAVPGDEVGFTLTEKGQADFWRQRVAEGDSITLKIFDQRNAGHGRFIWNEELLKVGGARPKTFSSRSWPDIVASAKDAYSATGDDFRGKMLLFAGWLIDFEEDRGLVLLVERAGAARKAYDDEYVEHGCWKVGNDGESNYTRWLKASSELARAMLDGYRLVSSARVSS